MPSRSAVDARYDHPDKVYIEVDAHFDSEGRILPLALIDLQGTRHHVDKLISISRAASLKAGGAGLRYTILLSGKLARIWLEEDRWFFERDTKLFPNF